MGNFIDFFDALVELLIDFLHCDYYLQGINTIALTSQDNYCNEVQSVCWGNRIYSNKSDFQAFKALENSTTSSLHWKGMK